MKTGGGRLKRFVFTIVVFVLAMGLIACGQKKAAVILGKHDVTFYGESENWAATYNLDYISGNKEKSLITMEYKGSDAKSVGNVEFGFEAQHDSLGGKRELREDGTIVFEGGISSPAAAPPFDKEVVKATVKWLGKTENIDLHYKN